MFKLNDVLYDNEDKSLHVYAWRDFSRKSLPFGVHNVRLKNCRIGAETFKGAKLDNLDVINCEVVRPENDINEYINTICGNNTPDDCLLYYLCNGNAENVYGHYWISQHFYSYCTTFASGMFSTKNAKRFTGYYEADVELPEDLDQLAIVDSIGSCHSKVIVKADCFYDEIKLYSAECIIAEQVNPIVVYVQGGKRMFCADVSAKFPTDGDIKLYRTFEEARKKSDERKLVTGIAFFNGHDTLANILAYKDRELVCYKLVKASTNADSTSYKQAIVKLTIPAKVKKYVFNGGKCRCESAYVDDIKVISPNARSIFGDKREKYLFYTGGYNKLFDYTENQIYYNVGENIRAEKFDKRYTPSGDGIICYTSLEKALEETL